MERKTFDTGLLLGTSGIGEIGLVGNVARHRLERSHLPMYYIVGVWYVDNINYSILKDHLLKGSYWKIPFVQCCFISLGVYKQPFYFAFPFLSTNQVP